MICLIEAPNDMIAMAVAAAVGASGTVSHAATMKLFTSEEAMKALALAGKSTGAYKSPMG